MSNVAKNAVTVAFDNGCTRCPRLAGHLVNVRRDYPDYHAAPVAPFGVNNPKLLIVGLAPGMHGANATGRPFTGDYAGILLYNTLYKYGYSSKPKAVSNTDGLILKGCRITNAVKCLPPQNKPTTDEIRTCNGFLSVELHALPAGAVILALGSIAHAAVLRSFGLKPSAHKFGHCSVHAIADRHWLIDSYHCSRYNTQTRRLTEKMFHQIFDKIRDLQDRRPP